MATASMTSMYDEEGREIAVVERHSDGYPEKHGKELVEFLRGKPILRGVPPENFRPGFATMSDLAAALVVRLKGDQRGEIYLRPAGTREGADYFYTVRGGAGDKEATVTVQRAGADVAEILLGTPEIAGVYREIDRFVMGPAVYRIMEAKGAARPYVVETAPIFEGGDEDTVEERSFTGLGGGVGTASGEFKTEGGARGFLVELGKLGGGGADEDPFWVLLAEWEGR